MTLKNNRAWKRCDDCSVKTRNIRHYKGQFICFKCWKKKATIINSGKIVTLKKEMTKEKKDKIEEITQRYFRNMQLEMQRFANDFSQEVLDLDD
jgi:hypothetical protein